MQSETKTRLRIAALIYSMTNAVIFGAGIVTVLNVPSLRSNASIWIPVVVAASLVLAAPAAWLIAPRLRARFRRRSNLGRWVQVTLVLRDREVSSAHPAELSACWHVKALSRLFGRNECLFNGDIACICGVSVESPRAGAIDYK
jgi:hypothetical protein